MIKTLLIAAVSVNGMIAQHADQNSLDWTSKEDTQFFVQKTKECGVVLMGRKTFETIGKPLKGRLVVVMSRDVGAGLKPAPDVAGVEWTDRPPREILADLERRGYAQVAICGGASIYCTFMREGLVDELFLTMEPIVFGQGVALFSGIQDVPLKLLDSRILGSGSVLCHYEVRKI